MGFALIHSSEKVQFTYDDYRQLPDDGNLKFQFQI